MTRSFIYRLTAWRLLALGVLGVMGGVLAHRVWDDLSGEPSPVPAPEPPAAPAFDAEAITKPHLDRAERQAKLAISQQLERVEALFSDAKQHTRAFAEQALSFSSKWRLAADYVPFTRKNRHQTFMRERFAEHVFQPEQLQQVITQTVKGYVGEVRSIENKMLVDLRADVADFSAEFPLAQLEEAELHQRYEAALADAIERTGSSLAGGVATQLASIVTGQVLTQVAVRLGVSAGILGTGAASGAATFGVGVAVGFLVDYVISAVWNWWADPVGDLTAELNRRLDEMHRLIVSGSPGATGLRDHLAAYAAARAEARKAAVLTLLDSQPQSPLP